MAKAESNSDPYFEHVFRQYHAPLFFYALKFVNNTDVAKDLVQDTFLGVLNVGASDEIKNLKAYLYKSLRNNCLNYIKHDKATSEFARAEQERQRREIQYYDVHQALVERELHQKIIEVIDELPEKYKTPFNLSRFEELSNKEIAKQLNIPLRTVETQIFRALKMLRKRFAQSGIKIILFTASKKTKLF